MTRPEGTVRLHYFMALSDWSSIAFDKDGKLTKSLLEIKDKKKKSSVEVRKNWL